VIQNSNGKLLIYASRFAFSQKRLKSVSAAVEKIAETLRLDLEFVSFKDNLNKFTFTTRMEKTSLSLFIVIKVEKRK